MNRKHDKKDIETRALAAARSAGVPIPSGEILGESPDFTCNAGTLGVEVSELLRPASSNHGIKPVAEESYHQKIIRIAHREYYSDPDAKPAMVILYFSSTRGKTQDTADKLAEFVRANVHRARQVAHFGPEGLPEGFVAISIAAESGNWHTGESGNVTLQDIRDALGSAIQEKNKRVPAYRQNLGPGAQVWLLLYSTTPISRGMPMPHGINEWQFGFDFDRVFWFVFLESEFAEIHHRGHKGVAYHGTPG